MVGGLGEDRRLWGILHSHSHGGYVLEGTPPQVGWVDECVGGFYAEGVRAASLEVQGL